MSSEETTKLYLSPIASPLMADKLLDRTYKLIKKAVGVKKLRRGVPEVVKAVRKGQKGLVILAADVYPVDVISHIPVFCEEKGIPYAYVPSRASLGAACQTKRAASAVMVLGGEESLSKYYEQVDTGIRNIHQYL
jgi:H/ACA ribonucleoprotein complex subunit 2